MHSPLHRSWARDRFAPVALILPYLLGCSDDTSTGEHPDVTKLSLDSVAVGDAVEVHGRGFIDKSEGWVDLTFVGKFKGEGASESQSVNLTIPLQADGSDKLRWERFGAYRVPFGGGDRIGTFEGRVTAMNRRFDETEKPAVTKAGLETSLTVEPSIVLIEARAVGPNWVASCKDPTTTVINGVNYLLRFRAVGFDAKQFDYTLGEGFVVGGATTKEATHYSVPMLENEHAVLLQLGSVPAAANGYRTSISVDATGTDGVSHRLELPLVVRRPLQVFFPAPMQIAQIYPAEPVSGCIPGGKTGVDVTYSESHSETRARTVASTETRGWTETYGKQYAETYSTSETKGTANTSTRTSTVTDGRSVSWSDSWQYSALRTESQSGTAHIDFSQTDTDSYTWSVGDELSAGVNSEVGVSASSKTKGDIIVASEEIEVGVQAKVGASLGVKSTTGESGTTSTSNTYSGGLSQTYGTSFSEGIARTFGTQWGISQTYSEANSYSTQQSWAKTAGYSEAVTDTETSGVTGTSSETVSETVSTTDTTLMNTTGSVPADSQAVWYRQTTRLVRRGVVVAYDLCGNGEAVGQITLDDWTWAPNLAIGDDCPPPTNLAKPKCFVEPCDN